MEEKGVLAEKELPDIMTELAMLKARSREKNNPKGWIIASLKGKLEDQRREKHLERET